METDNGTVGRVLVTTPVQLFYHLERGEVVVWKFFGGKAFLRMNPDGIYRVVLRSWFGSVCEMRTDDAEKVRKMFEDLRERGVEFWVCPGAAPAGDGTLPGDLAGALRRVFHGKTKDGRS